MGGLGRLQHVAAVALDVAVAACDYSTCRQCCVQEGPKLYILYHSATTPVSSAQSQMCGLSTLEETQQTSK